MPDLNANLLGGGANLGALALASQQQQAQQQQNLMSNIGNAVNAIKGAFSQQEINNALTKNFDQETQTLNQKGVIADLFNSNPQKALELQQGFAQQGLAAQKANAESQEAISKVNLNNAQAANYGATSKETMAKTAGTDLDNQSKAINQTAQLMLGANDKTSWDKTIAFAESKGLPVDLFKGSDFNPENKQKALGMLVDGKSQVDQMIQQQNANSNTMNASTNAQKAQQDYSLGQDRNSIDRDKNLIDIRGQDNVANIASTNRQTELAKSQAITPELQFKQNESIQKQNDKLADAKVQLNGANRGLETIQKTAAKLKDDPILNYSTTRLVASDAVPVVGNDVKEFKAKYDMLYNQVTGNTLQNIRAQSSTGASGFGSLTEKELPIVASGGNALPFNAWVQLSPAERAQKLFELEDTARQSMEVNNGILKSNENKKNSPLTVVNTRSNNNNPTFVSSDGIKLTQQDIERIKKERGLK